jgi:hypothetical protein
MKFAVAAGDAFSGGIQLYGPFEKEVEAEQYLGTSGLVHGRVVRIWEVGAEERQANLLAGLEAGCRKQEATEVLSWLKARLGV